MVHSMLDLFFDALRVSHMLSFALGIGAAAFLEMQVLKRFRRRIDSEGLKLVLAGHDLIRIAVITLWCTGLCLLLLRIGPLGGALTAKLLAKLAVVTLLTLNMRVIDRFVIPELFYVEGKALGEIPQKLRAQLGAVAGFSGGCWISALLIGGMSVAKQLSPAELAVAVLGLLIGATVVGAAAGAYALGGDARPRRHAPSEHGAYSIPRF